MTVAKRGRRTTQYKIAITVTKAIIQIRII